MALSLDHLYNNDVVQKTWPSDRANHSCENVIQVAKSIFDEQFLGLS